ncbi:MAG TPA: hypothetical protein VEQ35_09895 [Beijerinckia sp.]|nr:hypothetical protein [Beijerinckia sp.]
MIRFALRFIGLFLLAGAFAGLIVDATRSVAAGSLVVTPFGETALALFPEKLKLIKPIIEAQGLLPWREWAMLVLLRIPLALVIGGLGCLCFALAHKPRPKIGFSSR